MDANPYVEAVSRERRLREEAYLGTPHFVCGVPLKQITPLILAVLFRINTPFLSGGDIGDEDVLQFLWACHRDNPMREEKSVAWRKSARDKFIAASRELDFDKAERGIDDFMRDTFLDAPDGKPSRPYVCSIAWIEYSMSGKPFAWSREYTMKQPLRVIYQLLRCRALDAGSVLKNPISDPILQTALDELNTPEQMATRADSFRAQFCGFSDGYII